jgi:N-acetylneuraminic acid mutarotase
MNKKHTAQSAFFNLRILITVLLCAAAACCLVSRTVLAFFRPEAATKDSPRTLTFGQRVAYQRAIEDVYWRHRIWPKERSDTKPSLDAVMTHAQLENKVEEYLCESQALEDYRQRPLTAKDLQAEIDRMAGDTKQPEVLRELFEALGNDPFIIAECLAKPVLSERSVSNFYAQDQRFHRELRPQAESSKGNADDQEPTILTAANAQYALPTISIPTTACTPDTWTATSTTNLFHGRSRLTAVWTGSEMIAWGGTQSSVNTKNTGKKYNPSTDSWVNINMTNAPTPRDQHTAVWTGSEMIVWGGFDGVTYFNTGGRYNPSTDSWTATSSTNAPTGRDQHTAVWTGSEMIVWGGFDGVTYLNTGGKYNPGTNSWVATGTTNAPSPRELHTAVWTGSQMIIWGGFNGVTYFNTGGKYNPGTNSWVATGTTNAPSARELHTAVWTGSQMIVWGGGDGVSLFFNTGGRYDPGADSWRATSTSGAPSAREEHTAVWTGSEMIVFAGQGSSGELLNTGGRYCAQAGAPTPTPTPTQTPTPTPTPTLTPAPTPTLTILFNISTRSFVQTGNNVMIGGFIIQGTQPKTVILRAIGPELGLPPYNVPNALANPTLTLYSGQNPIASNDNWMTTIIGGIITSSQVHDIMTSGHAPSDTRESAIIATLQPGNYTAIVSGVNNTTGVGLVEVYDLD